MRDTETGIAGVVHDESIRDVSPGGGAERSASAMALGARMREELMAYSCLVEHGTKVPHWHLNPRSLHDRSTPAGRESQKGAGAPRRLGSVDTDILFPW